MLLQHHHRLHAISVDGMLDSTEDDETRRIIHRRSSRLAGPSTLNADGMFSLMMTPSPRTYKKRLKTT